MNPYATGDQTSLLIFLLPTIAIGLIVLVVCVVIVIVLSALLKKGRRTESKITATQFDAGLTEKESGSAEE